MTEHLQRLTDRFGDNYEVISARFFEHRTILARLGAFLAAAAGRDVEPEALERAMEDGRRSAYRLECLNGDELALWTVVLLLSPDRDRTVLRVGRAYRKLQAHFMPSANLLWAACLMDRFCPDTIEYDRLARTVKELYTAMGERHPLLTGSEDIPVCALYALREDAGAMERLEECIRRLRMVFRLRNSVQALGQVLAIGAGPEGCCNRALEFHRGFVSRGMRLGRGSSLVALGALAVTGGDVAALTDRTEEVWARLEKKTGLNTWGVSSKERLLWAGLLTALDEAEQNPASERMDAVLAAAVAVAAANTSATSVFGTEPGNGTFAL